MSKPKKLTPKQMRFCIEYASGKTLTEACKLAGIGAPETSGSRLLKNAKIRACIDEHVQNFLVAEGITESWVLKELKTVYQSAMASEHWQSAIGSLKAISEIGGYSNRVNKSEVKLVASFENLLERAPIDITPQNNGDVHSQEIPTSEILPLADPDSGPDLAESR